MKKLLLTLLCIFAFMGAKAQCNYSLEMIDAWGDGWAANTMDVLVNGIVVLNDVSAAAGAGGGTPTSEIITFAVNTGDDVTVIWSGGGAGFPNYEEEASYRILNSSGAAVATVNPIADGSGDIPTGTITANCPACGTPNTLTVTGISGGNATLGWTDSSVPPSTSFEYEVVNISAGGTQTMVGTPSATNSVNLTGLTSGGNQYRFFVRAICSGTPTAWSAGFNWIQGTLIPGCVTNQLPSTGSTNVRTNIVFSWGAPTTGAAPTGYEIFLGQTSGAIPSLGVTPGTSVTISGLIAGTTYFWKIVPQNAEGSATGCPEFSFTIRNNPPAPLGCTEGTSSTVFTEGFTAQGGWTGDIASATTNFKWNFNRVGGTPSGNTGPTAGQTGAYMYYEASGQMPFTANAISPAIIMPSILPTDSAELSFYMHGFGIGMGDLTVGVGTSAVGPFTTVFAFNGNLQTLTGDPFRQVGADLSAYSGQTIYVRFSYNVPTNAFTADLAIDTMLIQTCSNNTWNGSFWSAGVPPTIAKKGVIAGTYNSGANGNIDASSILINTGNTVTVAGGSYIRSAGNITVNGTLDVLHQGSVVQDNPTAVTVKSGAGSINVRKTTPVLAARDFMIIGSPMTSETVDGVYSSFINVQENFPANFVPNPAVAALDPLATNFADDNGNDWQQVTTGAVVPGRANLVIPQLTPQGSGSAALNYTTGTLNSGPVGIPLQYNGSQNASPNMLANPYASAIDADALYVANSALFDVVYFWEHITAPDPNYPGYGTSNYDMGDISMYNPLSGVGNAAMNGGAIPTKFIASGQGFAVKANSASTLNFTNAMRLTGNNNTYRRDANMELFYVNVISDTYSLASTTAIHFTENATNGYDAGYDNSRLATPVSIYGKMATGEELGIQSRAAFTEDDVVALGFSTQVDATENYTISINNLRGELLSSSTVFILDNLNGNLTNLSEGNYNFQSVAGSIPDRFTIMFRDPFLSVDGNTALTVGLYPNPANSIVTIASPKALINNVTIVDISGRIIENITVDSQNSYQMNISGLNTAIYFVKITTENGQITKRLIKN